MAQNGKLIELRSMSSLDETTSPLNEDGYDRNKHGYDENNSNQNHRLSTQFTRRKLPLDAGPPAVSQTPSEVLLQDNVHGCSTLDSCMFQNPAYDHLPEKDVDRTSQTSSFEWNWDSSSIHTEGRCPVDSHSPWLGEVREKICRSLARMRATVVRHLLVLQVVLFVISMVLSGMVFMSISLVFKGFRDQCVLFSDISLVWNSNKTVTVDLIRTRYGSERDCAVPTYIAVAVFVVCIIFSWFYMCSIFSGRASDENQSANSIQMPALLIFLGLFISTIVAAAKISEGFQVWCTNIVDNAPEGPDRKLSCSDFEKLDWNNNINSFHFYTRFKIAEVACWLLCVSLFSLCCVTFIGCCQMLRAADELMKSQLTISLTIDESEDGFVVVNSKNKQKGKAVADDSSLLEYTEQESTHRGDQERLLITEATVHSEREPKDNSSKAEQDKTVTSDAFPSDIPDGDRFVDSDKVALTGSINSSDGDETSPPSYYNGGFASPSQDEVLTSNEREALAKKISGGAGYGAVSASR